jgi:phytol kinase
VFERRSLGEVYFPAAVAVLFCLSHQTPLLFCIPILMLTLADAVAALIGVRYGRLRYQTLEGQKSAEGSITFFTLGVF